MTNANADDYAAARQNIFFTANDQTPADGNLTGQCVTLLKWFFQDMCQNFPSPFAARGNAKDVGHTLVAQGLAFEVPYAERRRGDVICYEYGTYGHIASQLSGGRVFEENVNWSGVAHKVVDGETVYASRIGSENEAWRSGKNPHIYRLKSYVEGGDMEVFNEGDRVNFNFWIYGSDLGFHKAQVGKEYKHAIYEIKDDPNFKAWQYINTGDFFNHVGRAPTAEEVKQYGFDPQSGTSYVTHKSAWYTLQDEGKVGPVKPTPPAGNIAPGTYLKVDPANVITVEGK